jgi:hypothetical protein
MDKASIIARSLSIYFRGDQGSLLSIGIEMSVGTKKGEDVQRTVCSKSERVGDYPRTSVFRQTVIPF